MLNWATHQQANSDSNDVNLTCFDNLPFVHVYREEGESVPNRAILNERKRNPRCFNKPPSATNTQQIFTAEKKQV